MGYGNGGGDSRVMATARRRQASGLAPAFGSGTRKNHKKEGESYGFSLEQKRKDLTFFY